MPFSSNENLILMLNDIAIQCNRFVATFILIFGTIGNILNCFVLSHRTLRSNPCTHLFLISSIANIISIVIGIPTRILSGWNIDPTNTISWICKCRAFFVFTSRTIAFWLIVLATIDRWLSSSINVRRRQMSTLKNAKRGILIVIFFSICLYSQMFYCYESNLTNTPLKCYGKTEICRLVTDLVYSIITVILPLILMFLFGLMTILNIRQAHNRIQPINIISISYSINQNIQIVNNIKQRQKQLNRHLLFMLFVEIIISILFTLPQAIDKLHSTFNVNLSTSEINIAVNFLIYNIVLLLSFLASGMPFYIYTLAGGTIYRNALKDLLQRLYRKLTPCFY